MDSTTPFALQYHGPPLPFDVPKAIPIDIDRIPVAFAFPDSTPIDPHSLPVIHPLPSPGPTKCHLSYPPLDYSSPTSVIENYDSSPCPDLSADLSVVLDPSGIVGFSDELKDSEAFSEGNALRKLSTGESTISLESGDDYDYYDNDDEVISRQDKAVTFRDSGEFSGEGSGLVGETPQVLSEEFEVRVKKGACYKCLRGNRFMEKEACLVCDAKYCSRCVLRAMGSMSEGRKCVACNGFPVMESRREKLGKSSRMLKRLLSKTEIQLVMKAEKDCEANQLRPENVCVNGKKISQEELFWLQNCPCPPTKLKPGLYWYDKVSGFWGKEGHKPDKVITPHLNVGGTLLQNASNGNTGILINGREITKVELKMLKWAGVQCAGNPHFWVNADGEIQEEGQSKILGHIWGKPMMKLLYPVLSLPLPNKDDNLGREEVTSLDNRKLPEYLDHKVSRKLLLVGYPGSGTSTVFKQAKFLYKSVPFSDNERQAIKFMIQSSVYKYLIMLLEGRELFEEESLIERRKQVYSSDDCTDVTEYSIGPRLKGFSDWLLTIMSSGNLEAIFPASGREHAPVIEELWNDPAIQATYGRISELQLLPTAARYFLERVVDISRVEYEPSDMDILYADGIGSCTGLGFTDLNIEDLNLGRLDIDDVDKQNMLQRYQLIRVDTKGLVENCKWLDMFEDARMVIYCVSLSDYDLYYEGANGVAINKIMESKKHFEFIASHPALHDKEFLLVLSKFDLLEQKIKLNPLTLCEWFVDFSPVTTQHQPKKTDSNSATIAQLASYYIAVKFKRLFASITGRKLYVKVINGLQAESVDSTIRYAGEIIKWEEESLAFEFAPGESFYSEPSSFLD